MPLQLASAFVRVRLDVNGLRTQLAAVESTIRKSLAGAGIVPIQLAMPTEGAGGGGARGFSSPLERRSTARRETPQMPGFFPGMFGATQVADAPDVQAGSEARQTGSLASAVQGLQKSTSTIKPAMDAMTYEVREIGLRLRGVDEDALNAERKRRESAATTTAQQPQKKTTVAAVPPPPTGEFTPAERAIIKSAIDIEPGARRTALVTARELRKATGLPKDVFDEAAMSLSRKGIMPLARHDFVSSLSPAERQNLVADQFVGGAFRPEQKYQQAIDRALAEEAEARKAAEAEKPRGTRPPRVPPTTDMPILSGFAGGRKPPAAPPAATAGEPQPVPGKGGELGGKVGVSTFTGGGEPKDEAERLNRAQQIKRLLADEERERKANQRQAGRVVKRHAQVLAQIDRDEAKRAKLDVKDRRRMGISESLRVAQKQAVGPSIPIVDPTLRKIPERVPLAGFMRARADRLRGTQPQPVLSQIMRGRQEETEHKIASARRTDRQEASHRRVSQQMANIDAADRLRQIRQSELIAAHRREFPQGRAAGRGAAPPPSRGGIFGGGGFFPQGFFGGGRGGGGGFGRIGMAMGGGRGLSGFGGRGPLGRLLGGAGFAAAPMLTGVSMFGGKAGAAGFLGAMGAGAAIKQAGDFESAMRRVSFMQREAGATEPQIEALRTQALELGRKTIFSPVEAAGAMKQLSQMGFSATQVFEQMPAVLALAAAGEIEIANAAEIAASTMRVFGMEAKDTMQIADLFTTAFLKTSAEVQDVAEALRHVGATARDAGKELPEIVAAIGLLRNAGLPPSMVGTGLDRFLTMMSDPKRIKKLEDQEIFPFDDSGKMKNFVTILEEAGRAMEKMSDQERLAFTQEIFGFRGKKGFGAAIAQGADEARRLQGEMDKAMREGGVATRSAEDRMRSFNERVEVLKDSFRELGIVLGTPLLDPFKNVLDGITDLVNNATKIQSLQNVFGGIAAAFRSFSGPFLQLAQSQAAASMFASVSETVSGLTAAFKALVTENTKVLETFGQFATVVIGIGLAASAVLMLTGAVKGLVVALAALLFNPLMLGIIAFTGLLVLAAGEGDTFGAQMQDLFENKIPMWIDMSSKALRNFTDLLQTAFYAIPGIEKLLGISKKELQKRVFDLGMSIFKNEKDILRRQRDAGKQKAEKADVEQAEEFAATKTKDATAARERATRTAENARQAAPDKKAEFEQFAQMAEMEANLLEAEALDARQAAQTKLAKQSRVGEAQESEKSAADKLKAAKTAREAATRASEMAKRDPLDADAQARAEQAERQAQMAEFEAQQAKDEAAKQRGLVDTPPEPTLQELQKQLEELEAIKAKQQQAPVSQPAAPGAPIGGVVGFVASAMLGEVSPTGPVAQPEGVPPQKSSAAAKAPLPTPAAESPEALLSQQKAEQESRRKFVPEHFGTIFPSQGAEDAVEPTTRHFETDARTGRPLDKEKKPSLREKFERARKAESRSGVADPVRVEPQHPEPPGVPPLRAPETEAAPPTVAESPEASRAQQRSAADQKRRTEETSEQAAGASQMASVRDERAAEAEQVQEAQRAEMAPDAVVPPQGIAAPVTVKPTPLEPPGVPPQMASETGLRPRFVPEMFGTVFPPPIEPDAAEPATGPFGMDPETGRRAEPFFRPEMFGTISPGPIAPDAAEPATRHFEMDARTGRPIDKRRKPSLREKFETARKAETVAASPESLRAGQQSQADEQRRAEAASEQAAGADQMASVRDERSAEAEQVQEAQRAEMAPDAVVPPQGIAAPVMAEPMRPEPPGVPPQRAAPPAEAGIVQGSTRRAPAPPMITEAQSAPGEPPRKSQRHKPFGLQNLSSHATRMARGMWRMVFGPKSGGVDRDALPSEPIGPPPSEPRSTRTTDADVPPQHPGPAGRDKGVGGVLEEIGLGIGVGVADFGETLGLDQQERRKKLERDIAEFYGVQQSDKPRQGSQGPLTPEWSAFPPSWSFTGEGAEARDALPKPATPATAPKTLDEQIAELKSQIAAKLAETPTAAPQLSPVQQAEQQRKADKEAFLARRHDVINRTFPGDDEIDRRVKQTGMSREDVVKHANSVRASAQRRAERESEEMFPPQTREAFLAEAETKIERSRKGDDAIAFDAKRKGITEDEERRSVEVHERHSRYRAQRQSQLLPSEKEAEARQQQIDTAKSELKSAREAQAPAEEIAQAEEKVRTLETGTPKDRLATARGKLLEATKRRDALIQKRHGMLDAGMLRGGGDRRQIGMQIKEAEQQMAFGKRNVASLESQQRKTKPKQDIFQKFGTREAFLADAEKKREKARLGEDEVDRRGVQEGVFPIDIREREQKRQEQSKRRSERMADRLFGKPKSEQPAAPAAAPATDEQKAKTDEQRQAKQKELKDKQKAKADELKKAQEELASTAAAQTEAIAADNAAVGGELSASPDDPRRKDTLPKRLDAGDKTFEAAVKVRRLKREQITDEDIDKQLGKPEDGAKGKLGDVFSQIDKKGAIESVGRFTAGAMRQLPAAGLAGALGGGLASAAAQFVPEEDAADKKAAAKQQAGGGKVREGFQSQSFGIKEFHSAIQGQLASSDEKKMLKTQEGSEKHLSKIEKNTDKMAAAMEKENVAVAG